MAKTHRTTAVTFAASAITGVIDVSASEESTETILHTDAAASALAVFADAALCRISVTTTDISAKTGLDPGDAGSLVVTRKERANGAGDGTTAVVETYAQAVYMGCQDNAGTAGNANLVLNFVAVHSSGDFGSVVAYT